MRASVFAGKWETFRERLKEIRKKKSHQIPGTISRYIMSSEETQGRVEMVLIWRITVMPDEETRQQAIQAF
jgi:hypothetical protein